MEDSSSPLRAAIDAWLKGRDGEAEQLLLEERREAGRSGDRGRVIDAELALASFAAAIDDDERATARLDALAEDGLDDPAQRVTAWMLRSELARRSEQQPERPDEALRREIGRLRDPDLAARAHVELACNARGRGDDESARRYLQRAALAATGASRAAALIEAERAEQELLRDDHAAARESLSRAIALFGKLDLPRDEGRALARYGEAIAPHAFSDDPPAVWFGRAQARLGNAATWRDRARIRAGFRQYGRRLPDFALAGSVATRIDALERASATLKSIVSASVDTAHDAMSSLDVTSAVQVARLDAAREALTSLPRRVAPVATEVEQLGGDLIELVGVALVERDRMQRLMRALAALDGIVQVGEYARDAAEALGTLLEADCVVICDTDRGCELLGAYTAGGTELHGDWHDATLEVSDRATLPSMPPAFVSATRAESEPHGPVLVVPIRALSFHGALYADKLARAGRFRDSDQHLARVMADFLAQGIARLLAARAEARAKASLEATLGAIREGVLSLDAEGIVRGANPAACRLVGIDRDALLDTHADEHDALEDLWQLLSSTQRVDGRVVTVGDDSVVVTARPIESTRGESAGVVATMVELDDAQRVAARVTSPRPRYTFEDLRGRSAAIREAISVGQQAATVDANVLITGESGTGKELLAQAIHSAGPRAAEPFVGINCAALPRDLLEAELFGYERGAFTGARSEGRVGKFEQAAGGTLLLDEIGDMPLDMQVKLLRVLQERVVVRLGGTRERPVPGRVIATTHRNLDKAVEAGTFRADLLYRLRVLHIKLPPLRRRPEDVVVLAEHFLRERARAQEKAVRGFGPEVVEALTRHEWPGNVRELANVIEREVTLLPPDAETLEELHGPLVPADSSPPPSGGAADDEPPPGVSRRVVPLAEVEKKAYLDALVICGNNVTRAAKALGVSKVTFYSKLKKWGERE